MRHDKKAITTPIAPRKSQNSAKPRASLSSTGSVMSRICQNPFAATPMQSTARSTPPIIANFAVTIMSCVPWGRKLGAARRFLVGVGDRQFLRRIERDHLRPRGREYDLL